MFSEFNNTVEIVFLLSKDVFAAFGEYCYFCRSLKTSAYAFFFMHPS